MATRIQTITGDWFDATTNLSLVVAQVYAVQNISTQDIFYYVGATPPAADEEGLKLRAGETWQTLRQESGTSIYFKTSPVVTGSLPAPEATIVLAESYQDSGGGGGGGTPGLPVGSIQYAEDASTFGGVPFFIYNEGDGTLNIGSLPDYTFSYDSTNDELALDNTSVNGITFRADGSQIFYTFNGVEQELLRPNSADFVVLNGTSPSPSLLLDNLDNPIEDNNGNQIITSALVDRNFNQVNMNIDDGGAADADTIASFDAKAQTIGIAKTPTASPTDDPETIINIQYFNNNSGGGSVTPVSALGYDNTTSGYNQLTGGPVNYMPLIMFSRNYGVGDAVTGTQSFNGGAQTLVLTPTGSPTLVAGYVVYIICTGDLAGYFVIDSIEPTGFVINKAFTTNQTGGWTLYSRFLFDTNVTENLEVTLRAVGASELVVPTLGTQESFTSIADNGPTQNLSRIEGTTNTGSILGLGRLVKITSLGGTYDGDYDVNGTPTGSTFVIDRTFTVSDGGTWESAIYTAVMKYTGATNLNAQVTLDISVDQPYTFCIYQNTGSGFAVVPSSISNTIANPAAGKRNLTTILNLSTNDEVMVGILGSATAREMRDIRFGLFS